MKNVLIFSVAYHPFVGGAEIAVQHITQRISPQDITFDMITVNLDGNQLSKEQIGNVTVYRVGRGMLGKFLLPITGFLKAVSLNKTKKYDVLWSIMASQASIAAVIVKKIYSNKKLILTLQEGDTEDYLRRYVFGIDILYKIFILPWYRLVFKNADSVTAISQYLKQRAENNNVRVPVTIVPNGVDSTLFSEKHPEQELDLLRKSLGKKPEDIYLITISRLVAKNAVADIVRSLLYLPLNIKLLIIGNGTEKTALKKNVEEAGIADRVLFIGQVPYREIPKYLHISDIFIRPSLSEGFGNAFVEAMAAGVPVIATPVGGIVDFIFDPISNPDLSPTGLFCQVGQPQSIADKVTLLLEQPALKAEIINNARILVSSTYDWNMIAEQMKQVIVSV